MNANIKLNNEFIDKNMLIKKEALLHTITNNEQHEIQMIPIDIQNLSDVNNELLKIPIDIQNLSNINHELLNIPIDIQNLPDIDHDLTIQEYHSIWKNTYETNIDINKNYNEIDISIPKCWTLTKNQMELTEQYIQHAQCMVNDNHTHEDMPKFREKYAHSPTDVLSLKRQNWLTGTIIMNTFLDTLDLNTENGSQKNNMNILHTGFYGLLTTTLPGYANTPQYNTYNLDAVRTFTDHLSRSEFLKKHL